MGDIDAIRQNATLKRLAMQVEFVAEVEDKYPRFITRGVYQSTHVFRPNSPTRRKKYVYIPLDKCSYGNSTNHKKL